METMHTIMHLVRSRKHGALRQEAGGTGEGRKGEEISHMESRALGYFARHPGATQRDLVRHSGRDKAQVARLVQGLRDKDLLEARQDEQDRRSTRLFLSPLGESVFAGMHRHGQRLAERALADLSLEERSQLARLLARVEASLRAEPD